VTLLDLYKEEILGHNSDRYSQDEGPSPGGMQPQRPLTPQDAPQMPPPPQEMQGPPASMASPMQGPMQGPPAQGPAAQYEAAKAQAPLSWWEKLVNPTGAAEAYANKVQKFQGQQSTIESQQAQKAAIQAQTEGNLLKAIGTLPPGSPHRQAVLGTLGRFWQASGIQVEPGVMDFLKKAEGDDLEVLKYLTQQKAEALGVDPADVSKYMLTSPSGFAEAMNDLGQFRKQQAETQKVQAEAKNKDVESQFLQGALPALQGMPGGASPQPQPPPQPLAPPPPQRAPGGFQGPLQVTPQQASFEQQVDQIGQRMGASPHVIAMVKSSGAIETDQYNPQAVSPKGAKGVMQFMPATAERFGVKDPTDTPQAIEGALKYYTTLDKMFPGSPPLQLAAYNAGEGAVQKAGNRVPQIPETMQYVQKGLQRYSNLLGGKPVSTSVTMAPDAVQGRIADLNTQITQGATQLKSMVGIKASVMGNRIYEGLQSQQDALIKERDSLMTHAQAKPVDSSVTEARKLGLPPDPNEWTPEQAKLHDTAMLAQQGQRAATVAEAQAPTQIKVSAAQGLEAQLRKPMSDEDRKNLRIYDAATDDWKAIPANWSYGDFQEKGAGAQRLEPVAGKEAEAYKGLAVAKQAADDLMGKVTDPKVVAVIGNIVSNPEGWLDRLKAAGGKDLDPKVYEVRSELSRLAANLQRYYAGTAQTAVELKTLAPFIVHLEDATPKTVQSKLKALSEGIDREYTTNRAFDTRRGLYVPKLEGSMSAFDRVQKMLNE
jgi:Transglycosylase SLT domain